MLDQIASHQGLVGELVAFSCAINPISPRSLNRLICAVRCGHVSSSSLIGLAGAASRGEVPLREFSMLLEDQLSHGAEGVAAAASILSHMVDRMSPDLWAIGRRVVGDKHLFQKKNITQLYSAKRLTESVLEREKDPELASRVLRNLCSIIEEGADAEESMKDVMESIAAQFPVVFLNECVLYEGGLYWQLFFQNMGGRIRSLRHPIDSVDPVCLVGWVRRDPTARAGPVARSLSFMNDQTSDPAADLTWNPAALELIGIELTAGDVLREFEQRFYFGGAWVGSEANSLAQYRLLIEALGTHPNPVVRDWVRKASHRLESRIKAVEQRERLEHQSFE